MKSVEVTIQGVSPILINMFKEQNEIPTQVKRGKKDFGSPRQQAESTAYCDEDTKKLWIPWSWISGCIRSVASDYKLVGTRKSVKSVSAGAVRLTDERIYFCEGFGLGDIEIDSRPCVVQRARIMRHRARLETWSLSFSLEIEDEILDTTQVHDILADAGRRAGLGDYRVEKGGPFGRFQVTSWQVMTEPAPVSIGVPTKTRKRA